MFNRAYIRGVEDKPMEKETLLFGLILSGLDVMGPRRHRLHDLQLGFCAAHSAHIIWIRNTFLPQSVITGSRVALTWDAPRHPLSRIHQGSFHIVKHLWTKSWLFSDSFNISLWSRLCVVLRDISTSSNWRARLEGRGVTLDPSLALFIPAKFVSSRCAQGNT